MRLIRFAVLEMDPAPNGWDSWEVAIGEVELSTLQVVNETSDEETKRRLLIKAEVSLVKYPEVDFANRLIIPSEERVLCESAIEDVANLISLLGKCSRTICSPSLCVALVPDSETEITFLEKSEGILVRPYNHQTHHYQLGSSLKTLFSFSDRMDGVALLSETYSTGDQSARYQNFMRLYELAFASSFPELAKKLIRFLPPFYGYESKEVNHWVDLRTAVSYADQRKYHRISLDANFRKNLLRMEQAAIDILFNKLRWNDPSPNRRNNWTPPVITYSPRSEFVVEGDTSTMKVMIQHYDDFGVFPKDEGVVYEPDEAGWYVRSAVE